MKKVVTDRHSVRAFTGAPIEEGVMEEILGYSLVCVWDLIDRQRCPSSMNAQPYRMILVRDQEKKEELATMMEAGNDVAVKTSGATVIICADQRTGPNMIGNEQSL